MRCGMRRVAIDRTGLLFLLPCSVLFISDLAIFWGERVVVVCSRCHFLLAEKRESAMELERTTGCDGGRCHARLCQTISALRFVLFISATPRRYTTATPLEI
jgi:hypothetical protein